MCSEIPKPKLPVALKFFLSNSNSFTLSAFSKIVMALSRLPTATWQEIFSLRRIPNVRTVYRALEKIGC